MYESIKNFPKQFLWEPEVKNPAPFLRDRTSFVIAGMGGSALGGELLKAVFVNLDIKIHRDYGLPVASPLSLIIASSFSGNTEETLDAFLEARCRGLPLAAVSSGGKLLELAKKDGIPYVELPKADIQPRVALGYSVKAILKLMGNNDALEETAKLAGLLNPADAEEEGKGLAELLKGKIPIIYSSAKNLAELLKGKIPIIYSSAKNFPIAYNWKIKFNETGKIPAFANRLPELNHNEMTGFDNAAKERSSFFSFIFLEDEADDPRILKRLKVTKKLYEDRKLWVISLRLEGQNQFHKIFQNLLIADFTAYYLAEHSGADPAAVPMIEEFKKMISA